MRALGQNHLNALIRAFIKKAAAEALALGRKKLGTLARALTGLCGVNKHNVRACADSVARRRKLLCTNCVGAQP